jgi:hypothetical protein
MSKEATVDDVLNMPYNQMKIELTGELANVENVVFLNDNLVATFTFTKSYISLWKYPSFVLERKLIDNMNHIVDIVPFKNVPLIAVSLGRDDVHVVNYMTNELVWKHSVAYGYVKRNFCLGLSWICMVYLDETIYMWNIHTNEHVRISHELEDIHNIMIINETSFVLIGKPLGMTNTIFVEKWDVKNFIPKHLWSETIYSENLVYGSCLKNNESVVVIKIDENTASQIIEISDGYVLREETTTYMSEHNINDVFMLTALSNDLLLAVFSSEMSSLCIIETIEEFSEEEFDFVVKTQITKVITLPDKYFSCIINPNKTAIIVIDEKCLTIYKILPNSQEVERMFKKLLTCSKYLDIMINIQSD